MADTLFTQLPVATALTGSEILPVDQPNASPPGTYTTKRTTTGDIARNLAPSNAINVILVTDTTRAILVEERASLLSFSNASPIAATLPSTGAGSAFASASWFCQIENRGAGTLTISPAGSATIDGAASLALTTNKGVVLAVGPDNNWYTQRGAGLPSAVTSVGLAAPSIFTVSGSPVTTTGTLTLTLTTQPANVVWAGPTTGADAAPTFRALVTADLPLIGAPGTYGSATAVPVITTDATGRVTGASTAAITPASITTVAASSLVGNATGAPAAATSISIGATFSFSGSTLQTAAGTGDVTWSANSFATTIGANAVTYAKFQQVAALSVVGNGTNATANAAAITAASDGQVLRRSGTAVAFGALSLSTAAAITGTLPVGNGGTGLTTYVVGDLIYASGTTTLARLADVATGNALISGGVGVAPAWGKIGLTTHVSGTLAVDNGGTGITTATAYAVICAGTTATGPWQALASVGTANQVLTSNGAGALPSMQSLTAIAPAGSVIDSSYAAYTTNADLTTAISLDDTIPQVSEGTQILSTSITPKSTTNKVRVRVQCAGTTGTAPNNILAALFVNGATDAVRASFTTIDDAQYERPIIFEFEHTPGSISAQTYTVRAGPPSGTMRLNGSTSARSLGGVMAATIVAEEIKA